MERYLIKHKRKRDRGDEIHCPLCKQTLALTEVETHSVKCQKFHREPLKEASGNALAVLMTTAKIKPKTISFGLVQERNNWKITWSRTPIDFETGWCGQHHFKPLAKNPENKGHNIEILTSGHNSCVEDYRSIFEFEPSGISITLLKSCLQKAIRRGNGRVAARTAAELMKLSFREFIRRLTIIVLEDVMLTKEYPILVWLLMAEHKGFIPCEIHIHFLLQYVLDLCRQTERDVISYQGEQSQIELSDIQDLNKEISKALIAAILVRSRYGGMKGDVEFLKNCANTWWRRLKENEEHWLTKVPRILAFQENLFVPKGFHSTPKVFPLLEGVDFHVCGWMVPKIYNEISTSFVHDSRFKWFCVLSREEAFDLIKNMIWDYRSSINFRKPLLKISTPEPRDNPKLLELWKYIEPMVNRISKVVLQKQSVPRPPP